MQQEPSEDWTIALDGDARAARELWDAVGKTEGDMGDSTIDVDAAWQRMSEQLASTKPVTTPVARVVPLATRSVSPAPLRWRRYLYAAAAAVALLILANTLSGLGETETRFANPGTTPMTVVLDDETQVQLSPNSELSFEGGEDFREAQVRGTAAFSVSPDKMRPFTVKGGSIEILVVGTAFEVEAGDPATVVVREGHVRARGSREADWIDLHAGDAASTLGGVIISAGPTPQVEASLRFEDVALERILEALEVAHGVSIEAPENLQRCELTVSLDEVELPQALQTLGLLTGARVVIKAQRYSLVGGSCR